MKGIVYKFTNKINGKVYIGQTVNEKRRYQQHKKAVGDSLFHRAVNKYKFKNFDYKVLFRGDENLLDEKEIYYISLYNSTDDRFGYNLDSGGNKNKHLSQETKEKMSIAHKGKLVGKHLSQETKDKISMTHKGKNNPMYGKHHTQESKVKMSKVKKGKYVGENNPNYGVHKLGKENPNYHKGNLFEYNNQVYSIIELSKSLNCSITCIHYHAKNGENEFKVKGHLIKVYKKRDS